MKKNIAFLFDKKNPWIFEYYKKFYKKKFKKVKILWSLKKLFNLDILFIINYTKKIDLNKFSSKSINLVIHESDLPKGKGFAPLQWQVLQNKKNIIFTMIQINKIIDSGPIVMKKMLRLNGLELYDELRFLQAKTIFKMIDLFIKKYPKIKFKKQKGKSTFYRKRTTQDSKLNINSSIKSQFNKLRVTNNNDWPAFFIYRKQKYIVKIFKDDKLVKNQK
tara:strand:+ start:15067 stop:15723 length:657 start_codon:yes stop_codon:yes gene_type:complete